MSGAQDLLLGNFSTAAAGYQIERSLRFNSADSAYLSRTPASASNQKTWTWSGWVKRSALSSTQMLFSAELSASNASYLYFTSGNELSFYTFTSNVDYSENTNAIFRDVSAWYHVVVSVDTTQATAGNRCKIYVNGVQQTTTQTYGQIPQNYDTWINTTEQHALGRNEDGATNYFNGYMADINFIDGSAKAASDFGETDADTGVWKPKAYSGSYGTNGFYLKFADNSGTTSTTLGKDSSGNGNNWTPNNFSVTAGSGNDSLVDSPTQYGTDTGAGGEVRGNYCVLNPLQSNGGTLSNGNLDYAASTATVFYSIGTLGAASGKYYFEFTRNAGNSAYPFVGAFKQGGSVGSYLGETADAWTLLLDGGNNGEWRTNGVLSGTSAGTFVNGDIAMVAVDVDAGKIWFGRNGTWAASGNPATGSNAQYTNLSGTIAPAVAMYNAAGLSSNFGQRPFAYTAPSGFKALCTQNLPTPTIGATSTTQAGKYFNTVLYTGTGSSLGVTGVGFQPDWVWIKSRSAATDHGLYDAVRGVQNQLESNTTTAETTETTGLTAFNTDGFTVGALAQLNTSTATYVAWNWKANGAGSTNNAGSIQSTVSANTTAGFSIVTYTGTTNGTVGHGLGVAPSLIIVKSLGSQNWFIYHISNGATKYMTFSTDAATTNSGSWNDTAPTSAVFTTGSFFNGNSMVAYCFAAVAGYSAFGSYTGNGSSDGVFVYLGFRARYLMIKRTDGLGGWVLLDTARDPYNDVDNYLYADSSAANAGSSNVLDINSNGFKIRNSWTDINGSSNSYIYAAFAEFPYKFSLAR